MSEEQKEHGVRRFVMPPCFDIHQSHKSGLMTLLDNVQ